MTNQTAIKPVPLTPANMTPEAYAQKDYVALPAGLKAEMARLSMGIGLCYLADDLGRFTTRLALACLLNFFPSLAVSMSLASA